MKDDRLYLIHILECLERIQSYTAGGKDAFLASSLQQDAVMCNLEIVGEATKHLSRELRRSHEEVPWRRVAGLRDVLIHDYLSVDVQQLWNIVERGLPPLEQRISGMLKALQES